jgi:RNA polymerase sigma-70 factor (ECF subfamily)
MMRAIDRDRTRWFLRNILPHEPALRSWLGRGHPAGLEIDDIIQEAYAVLADLDTVEGIRNRAPICFRSPVR